MKRSSTSTTIHKSQVFIERELSKFEKQLFSTTLKIFESSECSSFE